MNCIKRRGLKKHINDVSIPVLILLMKEFDEDQPQGPNQR